MDFVRRIVSYSKSSISLCLNRMSAALGSSAIQEAMRAPTQTLRMVLVVLIVIPIACAYPFFQRYIVSGLTIGSVKG